MSVPIEDFLLRLRARTSLVGMTLEAEGQFLRVITREYFKMREFRLEYIRTDVRQRERDRTMNSSLSWISAGRVVKGLSLVATDRKSIKGNRSRLIITYGY